MANNTFCTGLFSTCCAALIRVRSRMLPIFLPEAFVIPMSAMYLSMFKLTMDFTHGDNVPIFNGSPPL